MNNRSARSGELMVSVDMGAVPETLFESELFGHVKGAFTDARADRAGKFEVADHGTLFLDEIGNLPPHLQSKLLTAIQGGRIFRVGSNTPVAVDIRLICATNRDLFGMVARGAITSAPSASLKMRSKAFFPSERSSVNSASASGSPISCPVPA